MLFTSWLVVLFTISNRCVVLHHSWLREMFMCRVTAYDMAGCVMYVADVYKCIVWLRIDTFNINFIILPLTK